MKNTEEYLSQLNQDLRVANDQLNLWLIKKSRLEGAIEAVNTMTKEVEKKSIINLIKGDKK